MGRQLLAPSISLTLIHKTKSCLALFVLPLISFRISNSTNSWHYRDTYFSRFIVCFRLHYKMQEFIVQLTLWVIPIAIYPQSWDTLEQIDHNPSVLSSMTKTAKRCTETVFPGESRMVELLNSLNYTVKLSFSSEHLDHFCSSSLNVL